MRQPGALTPDSAARQSASAFAACARTVRCTSGSQPKSAPFAPSACRSQRQRSKRVDVVDDQAVAERERRVDPILDVLSRRRVRVGRDPVRAAGRIVRGDVRRDHGEILAARAQHAPHRRDTRGVERGEHRIGERRVGGIARDHRRTRRGAPARRRSARSEPRSDGAPRRLYVPPDRRCAPLPPGGECPHWPMLAALRHSSVGHLMRERVRQQLGGDVDDRDHALVGHPRRDR